MERDVLRAITDEVYGRGELPPEAAADLAVWRAGLAELTNLAMEQLAEIEAEKQAFAVEQRSPEVFRAARALFAERRAKVLHFKRKVDSRLREVNALIKQRGAEGVNDHSYRMSLLVWLLVEHLDHVDDDYLLSGCPDELRPTLEKALDLAAHPEDRSSTRLDNARLVR